MSELGERGLNNQRDSNSVDDNNTKFKNNILNYYFNSKTLHTEESVHDENSLENSLNSNNNNNNVNFNNNFNNSNNETIRSLSKNDQLNFNYSLRNNEIFYTPNRAFIEELEYENVLNPRSPSPLVNLQRTNISIPSGQSFTSMPSRVSSRRSFLLNNEYRPSQYRMSSNLFIDYNPRNNVYSNNLLYDQNNYAYERPLNGILKYFF